MSVHSGDDFDGNGTLGSTRLGTLGGTQVDVGGTQSESQVGTSSTLREIPDLVTQVKKGAEKIGLDIELIQVSPDYYKETLEERLIQVKGKGIDQLCKTILFQNTKYKPLDDGEADLFSRINPKYCLVCVQYIDKISSKKLNNQIRELGSRKQSAKLFNMRVTGEDVAIDLTGYPNGGVTPIGSKTDILVIITKKIEQLDQFFLGAGHVDWKLKVDTKEFIEKTNCLVWDISEE